MTSLETCNVHEGIVSDLHKSYPSRFFTRSVPLNDSNSNMRFSVYQRNLFELVVDASRKIVVSRGIDADDEAFVDYLVEAMGSWLGDPLIRTAARLATSWFYRSRSVLWDGNDECTGFSAELANDICLVVRILPYPDGSLRLLTALRESDGNVFASIAPALSELDEAERAANAEATRRIRVAVANVRLTRIVRKNLAAIKAFIWRPDGRLVTDMMNRLNRLTIA